MAYEEIVSVPSGATAGQIPTADGSGGYTFGPNAAVPSLNTSALSGTVTPADNTLYVATITSAVTISASSSSVCPLYSADFILTIGTGGSISFDSAVSITGDDGYTSPTAGEVWEINILRGRVLIRKVQGATV